MRVLDTSTSQTLTWAFLLTYITIILGEISASGLFLKSIIKFPLVLRKLLSSKQFIFCLRLIAKPEVTAPKKIEKKSRTYSEEEVTEIVR